MKPALTAEAEREWNAIPGHVQTKILSNVWCGHCSDTTTIVNFRGNIVGRRELLLEGQCQKCGRSVARLVEKT
jgi:hypothetical protein